MYIFLRVNGDKTVCIATNGTCIAARRCYPSHPFKWWSTSVWKIKTQQQPASWMSINHQHTHTHTFIRDMPHVHNSIILRLLSPKREWMNRWEEKERERDGGSTKKWQKKKHEEQQRQQRHQQQHFWHVKHRSEHTSHIFESLFYLILFIFILRCTYLHLYHQSSSSTSSSSSRVPICRYLLRVFAPAITCQYFTKGVKRCYYGKLNRKYTFQVPALAHRCVDSSTFSLQFLSSLSLISFFFSRVSFTER